MKIVIGADLFPSPITEKMFVDKKGRELFGDVMDIVERADRFIVNLECALTDKDTKIRKCGANMKADPRCAEALKDFGVTDVMLANNHVYDFGEEGLRDTMAHLTAAGLPYAGIGENDTDSRKPYVIEQDGKKIAIINVCEHEYCYALPNAMGANPFDPFLTMHDIREAKKQNNFVIVIYHGGKEYCRYPSPRLYLACHEMAECGADVVLTQHSHCIGCYEQYEGCHILYGQGNLNFIAPSDREGWFTGLLTELNIGDKIDIKFYPMRALETGVDLAKGDDAIEIMDGFKKRNMELQNGDWRRGWTEFCNSPEENYYFDWIKHFYQPDSSEHQNEVFSHYLDCEAHTDVWRELFPSWHITEREENKNKFRYKYKDK